MKISNHAKEKLKKRFSCDNEDIQQIGCDLNDKTRCTVLGYYIYKSKKWKEEKRELIEISYHNTIIRAISNKKWVITVLFPNEDKGIHFIKY